MKYFDTQDIDKKIKEEFSLDDSMLEKIKENNSALFVDMYNLCDENLNKSYNSTLEYTFDLYRKDVSNIILEEKMNENNILNSIPNIEDVKDLKEIDKEEFDLLKTIQNINLSIKRYKKDKHCILCSANDNNKELLIKLYESKGFKIKEDSIYIYLIWGDEEEK